MSTLPVANMIVWDWRHATTVLLSKVGQAETFALSSGATVDTTHGIVCDAAGANATLSLANEGDLTTFAYPFTEVIGIEQLALNGLGLRQRAGSVRQADGSARFLGAYHLGDGTSLLGAQNDGLTASDVAALSGPTATDIVIIEYRANGLSIWVNGTLAYNNTAETLTAPTLADTDYLLFGCREGESGNPKLAFPLYARIPGALDAADRSAIGSTYASAIAALMDEGEPPEDEPALVIDVQPTDIGSGLAISPDVEVRATKDGSTTDTGFTGNITATLLGSGGVLYGTVVVAAVAGVAVFDNLVPGGGGTFQLRFTASSYDSVDSDSFAVTSGSGSTIVIGASMLQRPIRRNEPDADLRIIFFEVRATDGTAWAGSVTGVKAKLSVNGGAESDSPDDIFRVAGLLHGVVPTDTYTDVGEGSLIAARVPAGSGRREALGSAPIIPGDSFDAGIEQTLLIRALIRAINGADGYVQEDIPGSNIRRVTIPGVGTIDVPAVFSSSSSVATKVGG